MPYRSEEPSPEYCSEPTGPLLGREETALRESELDMALTCFTGGLENVSSGFLESFTVNLAGKLERYWILSSAGSTHDSQKVLNC